MVVFLLLLILLVLVLGPWGLFALVGVGSLFDWSAVFSSPLIWVIGALWIAGKWFKK